MTHYSLDFQDAMFEAVLPVLVDIDEHPLISEKATLSEVRGLAAALADAVTVGAQKWEDG